MMNNMNFEALRRSQQAQAAMNTSLHLQQGADDSRLFAESAALMHQAQQLRNNLTFTTQDAAQRSVMEVLARHSTTTEGDDDDVDGDTKRRVCNAAEGNAKGPSKKARTTSIAGLLIPDGDDKDDAVSIPASTEGLAYFHDNDVLSGRGGGTNVHPGNRLFRDLVNLHRRSYLKARKNDKPAISRAIVKEIRRHNGRFLKRDEKSGLWFEVGDDAAREKTSQALRQRAPEMRKILFETEREHARQEVEDNIRQQHLFGLPSHSAGPGDLAGLGCAPMLSGHHGFSNMLVAQQNQINHQMNLYNPLFALQSKQSTLGQQDNYAHMSAQGLMTAALLGGNMNRFNTNGA